MCKFAVTCVICSDLRTLAVTRARVVGDLLVTSGGVVVDLFWGDLWKSLQ